MATMQYDLDLTKDVITKVLDTGQSATIKVIGGFTTVAFGIKDGNDLASHGFTLSSNESTFFDADADDIYAVALGGNAKISVWRKA